MSGRRKKKASEGGGNWMDTYGDMVTLLLTFFIMLYSMSNISSQKWEIFVKSIFPTVGEEQEIAINQEIGDGKYDVTGNMEVGEEIAADDVGKLYLTLAEQLNQAGIEGASVSRGDGYTFIQFQGKTFFNGDSSVLTDEGKRSLDILCGVIAPASENIQQIDIMGHTSQGDPSRPNNPRTDRMLSAMRSVEVTLYIQNQNIIEPNKLVGIDYGQYRPVDTVETREGRAKNRRVEFLIVDKGNDGSALNNYYQEYMEGASTTIVTDGIPAAGEEAFTTIPGEPEEQASVVLESGAQDALESGTVE